MDLTPEIQRFIRREIERQMNVILTGSAGEGTVRTETIDSLYPGSDSQTERPKASPYGFASIAKKGTISVVAKQGEHPGNRLVLLHRDANAPADLEEGEAKMYSSEGFQLYAAKDGIYCGKGSADKPLALGTPLNELLGQIIDLLVAHVHPSPGAPSDKSADFLQIKTETIEANLLLSTGDGGLA